MNHHGQGEVVNCQDALNASDAQVVITNFQSGRVINEEARNAQHFQAKAPKGTWQQKM